MRRVRLRILLKTTGGPDVSACSALKTPQILELSGIGRRDVLEQIDVPLRLELPGVGENVQEHFFIGVTYGRAFSGLYWYRGYVLSAVQNSRTTWIGTRSTYTAIPRCSPNTWRCSTCSRSLIPYTRDG